MIILFLMQNRFKIIIKNKFLLCMMAVLILIFTLTVGTLGANMNERSSVPIGIIDLDNTNGSKLLMENISAVDAFYVYKGESDYVNDLLKAEEITAVFTIKSGYEENINMGNTKGLLSVTYLKGSNIYKILSDIIFGEIMYPICISKSYDEYTKLYRSKELNVRMTREEYGEYADSIRLSDLFDFQFNIEYINVIKNEAVNNVDNSIVYKYAIAYILSGFISFIILFTSNSAVKDKEYGINKRLRTALSDKWKMIMADIMTVLIIGVVLSIIFGSMLYLYMNITIIKFINLIIIFELFTLFYGLIFTVLAYIVKAVIDLQIMGTAIIFSLNFLSVTAFLFEFIYKGKIMGLRLIPNYIFVEAFINIVTSS